MDNGGGRNPFVRENIASTYDAWYNVPLGQAVDRWEKRLLYRLAQPRPGERALDVGTGTGHFACDLARRGLTVTGVDESEAMLEIARAKCGARWMLANVESLPFPDESFDLVLCVTALEFVHDRSRAVGEMMRVLAPEGRLVVGVLNSASPWAKAYIKQASEGDSPFGQARFCSAQELQTLLGRHGRLVWNSAVHFGPLGEGLWAAAALEVIGQTFRRDRGALLVGRVKK